MQTFLPFPALSRCAYVLDNQRLQKQRVEVLQILNVLTTALGARLKPGHLVAVPSHDAPPRPGWSTHPAVLMWRDNPFALCEYALAICNECEARGIADYKGTNTAIYNMYLQQRRQYELKRTRSNRSAVDRHRELKPAPLYDHPLPGTTLISPQPTEPPWWWGDPVLHASHRASLLWKDYQWYHKLLPADASDDPIPPMPQAQPAYAWPIHADEYELHQRTRHPREDDVVLLNRYAKPRRVTIDMVVRPPSPALPVIHLVFETFKHKGPGRVQYILQHQP